MRSVVRALAASLAVLAAAPALALAAPPHGAPSAGAHRAPEVAVETSAGTIVIRLDPRRAPRTVANFLANVAAHRYDGASFYRTVVPGPGNGGMGIIQGGIEHSDPAGLERARTVALEPPGRTGLHNVAGTIAMARTSDPDSGRTEFFINLADDRFLDATGGGYAVFGTVVRGLDVARRIQRGGASGEDLTPEVRIVRVRRLA